MAPSDAPSVARDERELADLGETHSRRHRRAHALAGRGNAPTVTPKILPPTTTAVNARMAPQCCMTTAGSSCMPTRDKEDRGEHVADRVDEPLDFLRLAGLGHERAGQESAERDREAERLREERHAESEIPTLATTVVSGALESDDGADGAGTTRMPTPSRPDEEREQPSRGSPRVPAGAPLPVAAVVSAVMQQGPRSDLRR